MNSADKKLEQFKKKIQKANNSELVDSLILHTQENINSRYHEVVKIIREEILKRMK